MLTIGKHSQAIYILQMSHYHMLTIGKHSQAIYISHDGPLLHARHWQLLHKPLNNTVMHPVVRLPFEGLTSSW